MGFRRVALAALGQALLFGCGAGALWALSQGLYASALSLVLAGTWLGASAAWAARPRPQPRPPSPQPDAEAARAELRLLKSLIAQAPAPLLMLRAAGVVRPGNRAARALFRTDARLPPPPLALLQAM